MPQSPLRQDLSDGRDLDGAGRTLDAAASACGATLQPQQTYPTFRRFLAEGVRDTGRYVHSILGMDDAAFRASVFAEQKQLSAFSVPGKSKPRMRRSSSSL